jgi:uncharacterized membrane protein
MAKVALGIEIAAPLEQVFDYVADSSNALNWMHNFTRFEPIGQRTSGLGARALAEGRILGSPFRTELEITEFIKNRRLTSRSNGGVRSISHWLFEPTLSGTEVCFVAAYHFPGVLLVAGPLRHLVERELELNTERSLRNLKRIMENRRDTGTGIGSNAIVSGGQ